MFYIYTKPEWSNFPGVSEFLIQNHLKNVWRAMKECVEAGLEKIEDIETSGALKYPRKAF